MTLRKGTGTGNWKEDVLDGTLWRTRSGRGYGLVVRETTGLKDSVMWLVEGFYTEIEVLLPRVIISIENTAWAKNVTKTMTSIKDVSMCTGNNSLFAYRCAETQYAEYSLPILHVTHARTKRLTYTHTHTCTCTHKYTWMLAEARFKRDDTSVETRFGLSAKRTSPFNL